MDPPQKMPSSKPVMIGRKRVCINLRVCRNVPGLVYSVPEG